MLKQTPKQMDIGSNPPLLYYCNISKTTQKREILNLKNVDSSQFQKNVSYVYELMYFTKTKDIDVSPVGSCQRF